MYQSAPQPSYSLQSPHPTNSSRVNKSSQSSSFAMQHSQHPQYHSQSLPNENNQSYSQSQDFTQSVNDEEFMKMLNHSNDVNQITKIYKKKIKKYVMYLNELYHILFSIYL